MDLHCQFPEKLRFNYLGGKLEIYHCTIGILEDIRTLYPRLGEELDIIIDERTGDDVSLLLGCLDKLFDRVNSFNREEFCLLFQRLVCDLDGSFEAPADIHAILEGIPPPL